MTNEAFPFPKNLKSTINSSLREELRRTTVSGTDNEVQGLKPIIKQWLSVLERLDERKSKEASVHDLERDIRDLVCRLEDVLETCSIKFESKRDGAIKKLSATIYYFLFFWEFKSNINAINGLMTKTVKILDSLNESNNTWIRQEYIGGEDIISNLKFLVVDQHCPVIGIHGCGGIGKTTLIKKLYYDHNVREHFKGRAWINIDQNISIKDVFRDILSQLAEPGILNQLAESGRNIMDVSDVELARQLYNVQKDEKCLVVLDGMRSVDDWKGLRTAFPSEGRYSKLLFTTQVEEVASCVARDGYIHSMKPFTSDESWQLFRKRAMLAEVNSWKDEIGIEILEECKGIPSAIIATAELLASKRTKLEWETVLEEAKSCSWVERIGKAYNDLPYYLKPCFLYLGLFPKGSEIEVEHLYPLWIAEGILSPNGNETFMDAAERYLTELVRRNMVEIQEEEGPMSRKYRSCWVREHLQQNCLQNGKEYFFKVLSSGPTTPKSEAYSFSSSSNTARRLALIIRHKIDVQFDSKIAKHLRCLLLLNPYDLHENLEWPKEIIDLAKFQILRVLSCERLDFSERGLPRGMTKLIQLRYLSFRGCILKKLPSSLGNLSFLLILDLRVESSIRIIIPNVLWKMKRLKHLHLPYAFQSHAKKLNLEKLKELEVLENFDTRVCNVADLLQMEKLCYLSMIVEGNLEDFEQSVHCMKKISDLGRSLNLSIKVKDMDCYTEERHSVFRELLDCKILHSLHMDGHLGQIPWHNEITSSLTEIVLIGSKLEEDPMTTFEKLPKLKVLVLLDDAFVGKIMKCSAYSFGELKRLELLALGLLETCEVENGAMPKLSTLRHNCSRLKLLILPDELKLRLCNDSNELKLQK